MRILTALSKRCKEWTADNVHFEDWQLVGEGIAGDWRMIDNIAEVLLEEGFRDKKNWWEFWVRIDFEIC